MLTLGAHVCGLRVEKSEAHVKHLSGLLKCDGCQGEALSHEFSAELEAFFMRHYFTGKNE